MIFLKHHKLYYIYYMCLLQMMALFVKHAKHTCVQMTAHAVLFLSICYAVVNAQIPCSPIFPLLTTHLITNEASLTQLQIIRKV